MYRAMGLTVGQNSACWSYKISNPFKHSSARSLASPISTCLGAFRNDLFSLIWLKFCCGVRSDNFHLSKCCPGYPHDFEILWLCPQQEFPSLYLVSPQLVIGMKSSPPKANQVNKCQQCIVPLVFTAKYKCNWVPAKYKCTNTVVKHWNEL